MVTFTTNKALGLPAVGGDTGVWGPPLNNNSSVLDASLGGVTTIPISTVSGALTLLASNYSNTFIVFTGAITQNTVITLPAVGSFYTVRNTTTNTSAFIVTLQTTAAGGRAIGVPPGQSQDVYTDGTNVHFQGLPHIGAYWDYAGSSVPAWVAACTVPPWLNCDGTTFSSATYPYLATILGSTTLPDMRGRYRAYLNQGTARITSSAGVDGNTLAASGGGMTTISSLHLPQMVDPTHFHGTGVAGAFMTNAGGAGPPGVGGSGTLLINNTAAAATGITYGSSSQITLPLSPTAIGGICLVRAG